MATRADVLIRAWQNPQWESEIISKRPLRGPQAEIIKRVEAFLGAHAGGVMTIRMSRQSGKNDLAALLQRRHLWRRQNAVEPAIWIRTAPTYAPQIVNSKKRLRSFLRLDAGMRIRYPTFEGARLEREEGYIWRVGNASVEFISSGPNANVVGATASACLDMDEAHKVVKAKFDEDFAPFTANTNAGTLLWGVAADGLDTIEAYRESNIKAGHPELNLNYPAEIWMEVHPPYRQHVEGRILLLGDDHPIINTQYKLIPVLAQGKFINAKQAQSIFAGDHPRQQKPRPDRRYEVLVDIAAGNEEENPEGLLEGDGDTTTDSVAVWIYEVTAELSENQMFPVIHLVNLIWTTGVSLPATEDNIRSTIEFWKPDKVTIDAVGVGRQIAESMQSRFGTEMINAYIASDTSVSEDCFDTLARLNFGAIRMFANDDSPEWNEFERQVGWTKYASNRQKMKLIKPGASKHIDMVKSLTYINQNRPVAGMQEIYKVEGDYGTE